MTKWISTLTFLSALFFSTALLSQPDAKKNVGFTGKVIDNNTGEALLFATISLMQLPDSSLATGGVTDENGQFELEAKPGKYYAIVEFISYKPLLVPDIELKTPGEPVNVGEIRLLSDAAMLNEVEVIAEKSQVQMTLDKKVFNVGKDLANNGGTAVDILDNVPSLTVDVEGNVSLRGSGGVRILIDGRPSGLVGISGSNGLQSLPANLIESIEVITNPSSRYEAEGMAGIINIVLKKDRRQGFNGSFDLTGGYPDNYGGAFNLNFRKDKVNLFSNIGLRYRRGPGEATLYQEVYRGDTTLITRQNTDRNRGGWSATMRTGADFYFSERDVLTTAFNYRYSRDNNFSENTYRDFINSENNPVGITVRRDDEVETEPNMEYSMAYKHDFEQKGRQLSFDIRYQDNLENEASDLVERYFDPLFNTSGFPELLQRSDNKERERLMLAQMDYIHPFTKDRKLEAGLRSSLRNIDNDFLVEEQEDGAWGALPGLSNNFRYAENIHAGYLIFGDKRNRWSYQLGLRMEYTDITTELIQTKESNPREYFNLFPSAALSYELSGQNSLQISYSRRLNRPRFWDLNPFFTFSDNRNFFSGNPNLDPEFTHSMELGYLKYWDQASLSSAIYYRHTDGVIERIRTVDSIGNSLQIPQNLSTNDAVGLEVTFSYSPWKWWKLDGDANFFRSVTDGTNLDESFRAEAFSWFGRLTSRYTFGKNWDGQVRFNYRAPRITTQGKDKAQYSFDFGLSKDILNENATLTLSMRDPFNMRRRRYINEGPTFYTEGDFLWRAGQTTLTLNYRINQGKEKRNNRERGGDDGGREEF